MKKFITIASIFAFIGIMATAQDKAPEAKDGKTIFTEKENKCTMCHSVKSLEIKGGKTDLSTVGDKNKADDMKAFLKKEGELNGKKHGMAFKGSDEDLTILTKWLESLKSPEAK